MRRVAVALVLLASCDAKPAPGPAAVPPGAAPSPAPAGFGTIAGRVTVKGGEIAPVLRVPKGSEQHCGEAPLDLGVWRVDAASKALADGNVFVDDATGDFPKAPTPVLENRGCLFSPPVVLMAPGDLRIVNADTVPHSADLRAKVNVPENVLLAVGGSKLVTLRMPEIIMVGCSVHPWMYAVVIVAKTPFGALTDAQGRFEIRGVPAGKRRLAFWHRCVGSVDLGEVEVPVGGRVERNVEVEPRAGFREGFK